MRIPGRTAVAVVVALTVGALPAVSAQEGREEVERESLRGLVGVGVIVQPLEPDIERLGLGTEALEADIEAQLRGGGVPVLTVDRTRAVPGRPSLYVSVSTGRLNEERFAYSIEVLLLQRVVTVARGHPMTGVTWQTVPQFGTVPVRRLFELHRIVEQIVDAFVDDWRATH